MIFHYIRNLLLVLLVTLATATLGNASNQDNSELKSIYNEAKDTYLFNYNYALNLCNTILEKSKTPNDITIETHELISIIYLHYKDFKKATYHLDIAFSYWKLHKNIKNISRVEKFYGDILFSQHQYYEAESKYRKSIELKQQTKDTITLGYCYNALGNIELERCNYEKALKFYNKAYQLNKISNNKNSICYSINAIGNVYLETNKNDSAKILFAKADTLGKKYKLPKISAYSTYRIAFVEYQKHNYNKAIEIYNDALQQAKQINWDTGIGWCYMGIGEVFNKLTENDKAIDYQEKAMKIFKKYKDKKHIARCYANIGRIFKTTQNLNLARNNFQRANAIYSEIKDKKGAAKTLLYIGSTYNRDEESEIAENYYKRALAIEKEIKNKKGIVLCYNWMGLLKTCQKQYTKAYWFLTNALKLNNITPDPTQTACITNNLSFYYNQTNKYNKAIELLHKSIQYAKDANNKEITLTGYMGLSKNYETLKNYEKALLYYHKYTELYKKTYNTQISNKIGWIKLQHTQKEFENQLQTHKKEQLLKEQKLKSQRSQNLFLFIILTLSVTLLSVIFILYIRIKKTNKQLQVENNERKKAERALGKHQDNLIKTIDERTKELIIAKEKAEMSDKLKTSFLSNMSHEIRTPMNAIIGFTKLLTLTKSEDKQKKYTQIINNNSQILLTLVNDILDISMLESKQLKYQKSSFNLIDLLKELGEVYSNDLKNRADKNIDFILDIPTNISELFIMSDSIRTNQIITNLIRNAIKFTNKGHVTLGLKTTNTHATIFVEDTGIGIPLEDQLFIFDRFRQANNNTPIYGGTGLGLSIAKNLTELLGGRIWLTSRENIGSIFYIEFEIVRK